MKNLILSFLTLCFIPLHAQVISEFKAADVIALNTPDSCQVSVDALGRYFSKAFKEDALKARAIYTWTAMNIFYDVANMGKTNAATPFNDLVEHTMQTRTGICQGYASVFKALCDACAIRAYIINGFIRQNGNISNLSHAWVIAVIDTSYYGFDPTWGGGFMDSGGYTKQFNEQFFMIRPADLIKDHMPFDPLWECLNYPVSNSDFNSEKTTAAAGTPFFSYADSIKTYQSLDFKDQCQAALRRVESAGLLNNLIRDWADYLRACIVNEKNNTANAVKAKYSKQFNDAVVSYNNCIYAFNQYVDYWNRGFTPLKPEPEITSMLQLCYSYLDSCKRSLSEVVAVDADMKQRTDQLQLAIDVARENMNKQKVFLKIYFNTDPQSRPLLFKNYNGAGFPTNK